MEIGIIIVFFYIVGKIMISLYGNKQIKIFRDVNNKEFGDTVEVREYAIKNTGNMRVLTEEETEKLLGELDEKDLTKIQKNQMAMQKIKKYGSIKILKDEFGNVMIKDGEGNILSDNETKEVMEAIEDLKKYSRTNKKIAKQIKFNIGEDDCGIKKY